MNEYSFIFCGIITSTMVVAAPVKSRRTASREKRRAQLIDATMKCIARKGMGSTTLGDVAREAGLSQGIVNLHFDSKDNLLRETLIALAIEYREQFDKALERAGPCPANKLWALMEMDVRPSICNSRKLAIWFAFWGEVKSRPTYRRMCDTWDRYYDEVVENLCQELIDDAGYDNIDAAAAAQALSSMTNGLWLACLLGPKSWNREAALGAISSYLENVFPQHFPVRQS
jgi:TetR/AcrR family transcriptional repressor of bet genes